MDIDYEVVHTTEYIYDGPIPLCHNLAQLIPRSAAGQFLKRARVDITPQPDVVNEYLDFFGNKVFYFAIQREHSRLSVTVSSSLVKEMPEPDAKVAGPDAVAWETVRDLLKEPRAELLDVRQFVPVTDMTEPFPDLSSYALRSFPPGRPLFEAARGLMQRIYHDFEFTPGFTTVSTPIATVFRQRKGVCQDFAHLAIACLRSLGLAARYVSGYIETVPPPGQEKLTGVDASHAWFSVFIPGTGWVDFDPTNNLLPAAHHITIGWGRDYSDITPLKGVILSSGNHKLRVAVTVKRV